MTGYALSDVKLLHAFMKSQLYIVFSKQTSPEIAQAWQQAFLDMQRDGSFAKIYSVYFPGKELPGPPMISE